MGDAFLFDDVQRFDDDEHPQCKRHRQQQNSHRFGKHVALGLYIGQAELGIHEKLPLGNLNLNFNSTPKQSGQLPTWLAQRRRACPARNASALRWPLPRYPAGQSRWI